MSSQNASFRIDLDQFNLVLTLPDQKPLTLHFDSASRRFYLSVMALVLHQMKKTDRTAFIPLAKHADVLAMLNETIGGSMGSSDPKNLLPRIYRKWKDALPDLEAAPLFRIPGHRKTFNDDSVKTYEFGESTKDAWANLFVYRGSGENTRLGLRFDPLGISMENAVIAYGPNDSPDGPAPFDRFVKDLSGKVKAHGNPVPPKDERTARPPSKSGWGYWGLSVLLIAMAVVSLFLGIRSLNSEPKTAERTDSGMTQTLKSQEKPSIAVLPFNNMSGDPDQEYIADGISENIISSLSKIGEIFVIARNSTFTYKNKPVKVQQVAEDLGVRYVLEGSVMKSGDTFRISAQLIDAENGYHLWAEKFDRKMADFFQVMDEITREIAVALQVNLTHGEQAREWYTTTNFEAWGELTKGMGLFETYTKGNNERARKLFQNVVDLDPNCAFGWLMVGWTHFIDVRFAFNTKNPAESIAKTLQYAEKARSIDPFLPEIPATLSQIYLLQGRFEQAVKEGDLSIELGPNSAISHILFSQVLYYTGNHEKAILMGEQAMRLCPHHPAWYEVKLGRSYSTAGRFEDSIRLFKEVLERAKKGEFPLWLAYSHLAITYSMMGQYEKAQSCLNETLRLNPTYSYELVRKINFYKDPKDLEAIFDALRQAGLPDEVSPQRVPTAPDKIHFHLNAASASFTEDTRQQACSRIAYCKRLVTQ